jgi:hypothetical protein
MNANAEKPSIGSLISGLLGDIRDLLAAELKVARTEIGEDIQKTKGALTALGIGLVILAISVGLLLLMVVHLLHAITNLPLWASYGIVGVVVAAVGIGLLIVAKNKGQGVDFAPEQTVAAVKEDVGWIRARVMSNRIGKGRGLLSLRR